MWGRVKLLYRLLNLVFGAFVENDWSTGGTPAWVIPIAALWMFGGMALMRLTAPHEKLNERELWAANPLRDLSTSRAYKPVFFHVISLGAVVLGLGVLTRASFHLEDGRTFHGFLFLSVGVATWIGLRIRDWVFVRKERR